MDNNLPSEYLQAKLNLIIPVFQEARDALTVISVAQMKLHGISSTLADRMDVAGTYSFSDWERENQRVSR